MKCIHFFLAASMLLLIHSAALAQTETPTSVPVMPFTFDQPLEGILPEVGEAVAYRFEIPRDQDVVLTLSASGIVTPAWCYETITAAEVLRECPGGGGGGIDIPMYRVIYFPTNADPDVRQFVDLRLHRFYQGSARYTLTAYRVTPQPLTPNTVLPVNDDDLFHAYTFENDPEQAFFLQVEQNDPDGEFLWVAYQPYTIAVLEPNASLQALRWIDGASASPPNTLINLWLFYVDGERFRALVGASSAYTLYATQIDGVELEADAELTRSISYRQPINLVRLNNPGGGSIKLTTRLMQGAAATVRVFAAEHDALVWQLGYSSTIGAAAATTRTIDVPGSTDILVVLELLPEFTRESVAVMLEWEAAP